LKVYVDHIDDGDVIAVTRHNPTSHESIVLIAHTAFNNHGNTRFNTFRIPLKVDKILFEAKIQCNTTDAFKRSANYINYLDNVDLHFQDNLFNNPNDLARSYFISSVDECSSDHGTSSILHFKHFPPGSVLAFHGRLSADQLESIRCIGDTLGQMDGNDRQRSALESIVKRLGFDDLNIILYRCSNEEQDEDISSDVYVVPNHGPLLFCGLQGIMNVLKSVRSTATELSHPIFDNLRQGDWLIEYITRRLRAYVQSEPRARSSSLLAFVNWLDNLFCHLCRLPRYLIPSYFNMIVTFVYNRLLDQAFVLMAAPSQHQQEHLVAHGSSFIHSLALCSIQLVGHVKSAHLPDTIVDCDGDVGLCLSIAAGAPHFSYGIWRNWGRDTFIALRGLLLLTNRYADAKRLILAYGSCLRHGLIPNLLCEGINARYNARDAIWWWLKAIRDYTEIVPDGHLILHAWVYRIYPTDESTYPKNPMELKSDSRRMKLLDIIQEALCKHVNGMRFLEANAGPAIDEHMRSDGFYNTIGVHLPTGFVYGGNRYNCGTWMDKMGSSSEANTKGTRHSGTIFEKQSIST
jgi:glycogen debranching enzyme